MNAGAFKRGHRNTHDVSAAGRKGKANSPWRKGCPWLSGCGDSEARVRSAQKRERIAREKYPGALRRPLFTMEGQE